MRINIVFCEQVAQDAGEREDRLALQAKLQIEISAPENPGALLFASPQPSRSAAPTPSGRSPEHAQLGPLETKPETFSASDETSSKRRRSNDPSENGIKVEELAKTEAAVKSEGALNSELTAVSEDSAKSEDTIVHPEGPIEPDGRGISEGPVEAEAGPGVASATVTVSVVSPALPEEDIGICSPGSRTQSKRLVLADRAHDLAAAAGGMIVDSLPSPLQLGVDVAERPTWGMDCWTRRYGLE